MERRLSAILAADISGYSRLLGEDEEATIRAVQEHQAALVALIQEHGGRVIDTAGDSILAEFASRVGRSFVVSGLLPDLLEPLNLSAYGGPLNPRQHPAFRDTDQSSLDFFFRPATGHCAYRELVDCRFKVELAVDDAVGVVRTQARRVDLIHGHLPYRNGGRVIAHFKSAISKWQIPGHPQSGADQLEFTEWR
jgi:class 3 adenylate cyclase